MKLYAAQILGKIRRLCQEIDASSPRWALILFVTSLGALLLVELDRRFYSLGIYTVIYINLNYLVAVSTAAIIAVRFFRARRRAVR